MMKRAMAPSMAAVVTKVAAVSFWEGRLGVVGILLRSVPMQTMTLLAQSRRTRYAAPKVEMRTSPPSCSKRSI
jgi:hypothetical protein